MHPGIDRERQKQSHGRNRGPDLKENPGIDLGIGLDPANGNRTVGDGHDPGSMTKAGGSTENLEVGMMKKTKVTTIEGHEKGTPASTRKDHHQPSDLLRPKRNTATVNRSVFLIMNGHRPQLLRWTSNHHMEVEENPTAMSILRVSVAHYCRTTTCGMTILVHRNSRNHCRKSFLNIFLLHLHRQQQPKPLLRHLLSLLSQVIQRDTTTNKPPNLLLINLLRRP